MGNQEISLKRLKVECLLGIGNHAEAEGLTRRFLSQNPSDTVMIFLRAQVCIKHNNNNSATTMLTDLPVDMLRHVYLV